MTVPDRNQGPRPVRFVWGLHAGRFPAAVREAFVSTAFRISRRMDRMGVRLEDPEGVFAGAAHLSLVSDAIVPGDIQILGDGTPIVLMRDHQPTGGYPRIATVAAADLDRFVQLRTGSEVRFQPVTVRRAQGLSR
jgi:5-oxoprolinase (ATP-hydrolysing) subunit C